MPVSVRFNEEENRFIREYAKMMGISVSELIRKATLEQIEDELDLKIGEDAYKEYLANPVTYTHEEMKKELGL
ncbi:MAG: type II toxin-antitoxin system RelB family antitoxin [Christensenellaceae bacterium]|jgi:RHH-type rel operon transcriptional repressor/antitoxin RelB